jgi:hypothetical protein
MSFEMGNNWPRHIFARQSARIKAAISPPSPAAPSSITSNAYDGTWRVTQTCPATSDNSGYGQIYNLEVKNGIIRGQLGPPGRNGSFTYTGIVRADGTTSIAEEGLSGPTDTRPGVAVYYEFTGKLEGTRGTGVRTLGRPCSFVFAKN